MSTTEVIDFPSTPADLVLTPEHFSIARQMGAKQGDDYDRLRFRDGDWTFLAPERVGQLLSEALGIIGLSRVEHGALGEAYFTGLATQQGMWEDEINFIPPLGGMKVLSYLRRFYRAAS